MSDALVNRLRDDSGDWLTDLAADRIEELEAKLAKAVIGLRDVIGVLDDPTGGEHVRDMRVATMIARTTIAELTSSEAAYGEAKGGKDE